MPGIRIPGTGYPAPGLFLPDDLQELFVFTLGDRGFYATPQPSLAAICILSPFTQQLRLSDSLEGGSNQQIFRLVPFNNKFALYPIPERNLVSDRQIQ